MPDLEDIFGDETAEDIYARLVNDMPPPPSGGALWETREGSIIHAVMFPTAVEEMRLRDFARDIAGNIFLWWCVGDALDAKASEFGLVRQPEQRATGTVTFVGAEATTIPLSTLVSTETDESGNINGVSFITVASGTVAGGYVDIPVQAIEDGTVGNVQAGSIVVLQTPVPGVTAIQNAAATFGGVDFEADSELRQRAVIRAGLRPQGGNKDAYVVLGTAEEGVSDGYVEDLWNIIGPGGAGQSGVGSARLMLTGDQVAYVSPTTIDQLQLAIDPSVQILSHFESPEVWAISSGAGGSAEQTAAVIEGGGSWRVHPGTSLTTEITRTLASSLNLSGFGAATDEWWVELIRTTAAANFSALKIMLETGDGLHKIERDIPNAQIATGRIVWMTSNWVATVGTVASALAAVKVMRVRVTSTAVAGADVTVDGLRARNKAGGRGDGLANVGVQITVRSAHFADIEVSAVIVPDVGVSLSSITSALQDSVTVYLNSLGAGSLVRITGVANAIHDTFGVIDYSAVQIRRAGGAFAATNIQLVADERPRLGPTNVWT